MLLLDRLEEVIHPLAWRQKIHCSTRQSHRFDAAPDADVGFLFQIKNQCLMA